MSIRAVLFDVGGPLDTEVTRERRIDAEIRDRVEAAGIPVSNQAFLDAQRHAVESFAPNAYTAIIFALCGRDAEMAKKLSGRFSGGLLFELRDGIPKLLASLHSRGLKLGLAANQPAAVLDELDRLGIGRYFAHRQVSGHHGFHKPDVRLFLAACDELRVRPEECVMVGDRIDNDIVPAKLLGMRTVLLRTGRHISQQPRSVDDVPDREVTTVSGMGAAIDSLIAVEV